jgi:hypothetical protein
LESIATRDGNSRETSSLKVKVCSRHQELTLWGIVIAVTVAVAVPIAQLPA